MDLSWAAPSWAELDVDRVAMEALQGGEAIDVLASVDKTLLAEDTMNQFYIRASAQDIVHVDRSGQTTGVVR